MSQIRVSSRNSVRAAVAGAAALLVAAILPMSDSQKVSAATGQHFSGGGNRSAVTAVHALPGKSAPSDGQNRLLDLSPRLTATGIAAKLARVTHPTIAAPNTVAGPVPPSVAETSSTPVTKTGPGSGEAIPGRATLSLAPTPNAPAAGSFPGIGFDGRFEPDTSIAAGPGALIQTTNATVELFRKNGAPISSSTVAGFFSPLGPPATVDVVFEPSAHFDEYINRFWVIAASANRSTSLSDTTKRSSVLLALSATSDPSGSWSFFNINMIFSGSIVDDKWCDDPKLGYDADAIYLSCNMFGFPAFLPPNTISTVPGFQYTKVRILTKSQFIAGASGGWWDFWNLREGFLGIGASFGVTPAHMTAAAPGSGEFLVNAHGGGGGDHVLEIWRLTNVTRCCNGSTNGPTLDQHDWGGSNFDVAPNAQQGPIPAGQAAVTISTGDTRTLYAFYRNGFLTLGQTAACKDQTTGKINACAVFKQLFADGFPNGMTTLNDWAEQAADIDFFMPYADINAVGTKTMVMSRSSPTSFPGSVFDSIPNSNSCTICRNGPFNLRDGDSYYANVFPGFTQPGTVSPWGLRMGAGADPDGTGIWIAGQFSTTLTQWGTQIGLTQEALDLTPPIVTAAESPLPNALGWNRTPVTVTLTASDPGSGVRSIEFSATGANPIVHTVTSTNPVAFTISAEGTTTVSFSATDNAGNSTPAASLTVRIDKTAPVIQLSATTNGHPYACDSPSSPPPLWPSCAFALGFSGMWTNHEVIVTIDCSDALSGAVTAQTTQKLSSEGANLPLGGGIGTCTDRAGNTTSATFAGINIDLTPPVIRLSATTNGLPYTCASLTSPPPLWPSCAPGFSGNWTSKDVTVAIDCSDALSGVETAHTTKNFASEGANWGGIGTCTDRAGNTTSATYGGINIDKTPPTITWSWTINLAAAPPCSALACTAALGPTDSITGSCLSTDALSGVLAPDGCFAPGFVAPAGSCGTTIPPGSSTPYNATTKDLAGNSTTSTLTVTCSRPTFASLRALTLRFVTNNRVAASLIRKLDRAESAFASGDISKGNAALEAYRHQVSSQIGKSISATNAAKLRSVALALERPMPCSGEDSGNDCNENSSGSQGEGDSQKQVQADRASERQARRDT